MSKFIQHSLLLDSWILLETLFLTIKILLDIGQNIQVLCSVFTDLTLNKSQIPAVKKILLW
jgi:hypothetical protein